MSKLDWGIEREGEAEALAVYGLAAKKLMHRKFPHQTAWNSDFLSYGKAVFLRHFRKHFNSDRGSLQAFANIRVARDFSDWIGSIKSKGEVATALYFTQQLSDKSWGGCDYSGRRGVVQALEDYLLAKGCIDNQTYGEIKSFAGLTPVQIENYLKNGGVR